MIKTRKVEQQYCTCNICNEEIEDGTQFDDYAFCPKHRGYKVAVLSLIALDFKDLADEVINRAKKEV